MSRLSAQVCARAVALLLLLALGLGLPRPAEAQTGVVIDALTVELWPEYDQPAMLVILRVTLAPVTSLPATVTLHLPAASKGPSAVALQDATGQLLTAPYTTAVQGDTIAVQLQASTASFQIEYYDPGLKISGDQRDFTFQSKADYPVNAATLLVQAPVGAHDLTADPPLSLVGSSGQGLDDYTASLGALTAGQTISARLTYAKSTATLSKPTPGLAGAAPTVVQSIPATQPTFPGGLGFPGLMVGGVGLVSIAVIVGAGVWFQRQRRPAPAQEPQTRVPQAGVPQAGVPQAGAPAARMPRTGTPGLGAPQAPTPKARVPATDPVAQPPLPAAPGTAQFCTQCGRPALADDRFCRGCGTPLRYAPAQQKPG